MSSWSGPPLPTGTLTFLFTDVEGSSGPWEQHPQLMRAAMARHDALLTKVFDLIGHASGAQRPHLSLVRWYKARHGGRSRQTRRRGRSRPHAVAVDLPGGEPRAHHKCEGCPTDEGDACPARRLGWLQCRRAGPGMLVWL
jgi:hypothetical protein